MKKFWNWIHDDSGGRVLRLEGPIDNDNFWGDEITPAMFRDDLEAEDGDVTVWIDIRFQASSSAENAERTSSGTSTLQVTTGMRFGCVHGIWMISVCAQ